MSGKKINPQELVGQRFGLIEVLEFLRRELRYGSHYHYVYRCRCDCGKVKEIRRSQLLGQNQRSCGCKAREAHQRSMQLVFGRPRLTNNDRRRHG